jgi:hypothetical protein
MTAQIDDIFRYEDAEYAVCGISEGTLFNPSLLGLNPVGTCSACWRGYQAVFAIADSRLVLDTLHVNLLAGGEGYARQEGPPINGVSPTGPRGEHDWFNNHYDDLAYPLEYTGGLLLGDGFIRDLYVHMGFHPAWKYKAVIELVFESGILQAEFDRSRRMARFRERLLASRSSQDSSRMPSDSEIRQFIEQAFGRTYQL